MINWLKYVLDEKNQVADDIILESVLLAGTAAMDDQCAKLLAKVSKGRVSTRRRRVFKINVMVMGKM